MRTVVFVVAGVSKTVVVVVVVVVVVDITINIINQLSVDVVVACVEKGWMEGDGWMERDG